MPMDVTASPPVPRLDRCDRSSLFAYFEQSWALEESLMRSLITAETFYLSPDPLRNPLIFYLGHSAAFYINKLMRVGLLHQHLNPDFETLFEMGVDPATTDELDDTTRAHQWPSVADVWDYRDQVKTAVTQVIDHAPLDLPIHPDHPLWALMMGIEHSRIHFETSSMLLRQLPCESLARPKNWHYAPWGQSPQNSMVQVGGGVAHLGKPKNALTYGWDNEYGHRTEAVAPFLASQYLITNSQFLQFVEAEGYENQEFWDAESWQWKTTHGVHHPKFWIPGKEQYQYRALFDQLDLPLDWPVEVNHHEATAYCRWIGEDTRLMTEAEWHVAVGRDNDNYDYNLNFAFSSPSPVGYFNNAQQSGLYDLRGNVWEWLSDDFTALPGFEPHPLYEEYSTPFFDQQHKLMLSGSWASTGTYASPSCRNWFRRNFYQHAGFRIAQSS